MLEINRFKGMQKGVVWNLFEPNQGMIPISSVLAAALRIKGYPSKQWQQNVQELQAIMSISP